MTKIIITNLGQGYYLKFDGLRERCQWTGIGPNGRIKDAETKQEIMMAIEKEKMNLPEK